MDERGNGMEIKTRLLKEIPVDLVCYLQKLELNTDSTKQAAIPVYYKEGRNVFFISDYVLRDNRAFEKSAPVGLYRGGALLEVMTKQGRIVIYDERYKWLRMVGGIARHSEGADLMKTAIREGVVEELSVLVNGEKTRLVPIGTSGSVGLTIEGWGITTENIEETGSLEVVKTIFNKTNHAFELVVQWDVSDRDGLIVLHSEDWFKGGRSGFVPLVIDDIGDVIGFYDGRHGFVPIPVQNLHPTLASVLRII
jgi:hypothetical protein